MAEFGEVYKENDGMQDDATIMLLVPPRLSLVLAIEPNETAFEVGEVVPADIDDEYWKPLDSHEIIHR